MEPATSARALRRTASEVVHHPECGPIFLNIFIGAIYSLPRYIASSPQGVYRSKTRDAHEG